MIRITAELVPHGVGEPVHLGTAIIANDGKGVETIGHYNVWLGKKGQTHDPVIMAQSWRYGRVESFPRKRLGVWDLLYRALRATVGPRNEK
jgi:hypothetical protein